MILCWRSHAGSVRTRSGRLSTVGLSVRIVSHNVLHSNERITPFKIVFALKIYNEIYINLLLLKGHNFQQ